MNITMRPVAAYLLLAYGLAWLVCLPLWLDPRGLTSPLMIPTALIMMGTPTVATLIVLHRGERRSWRDIASQLRLGLGGSPGRLLAYLGLTTAAVYVCVLGALTTSSLLGRFDADLGFSGLGDLLAQGGPALPEGVSLVLLAIVLLAAAPAAGVLNTIPALGEELGWRGFLFPRLHERYGTLAALLGSGIAWGLWHAPMILLGYNYPLHPVLGLLAFCVVCTLLTGVLAWVTQRSGSIWPAAYGHGLVNALAPLAALMFQRAGSQTDMLHATVLGWSGWLIPAVLVAVLVAYGAFTAPRPAAEVSQPDHPDRAGTRVPA